jgi:hypothetical protein
MEIMKKSFYMLLPISLLLNDPNPPSPPTMASLSIFPPNLLGQEGLRREGILDVTAIDQKGIVSRRRSPMSSKFGKVYKKIKYRLIRPKVCTAVF